MKTIFCVIMCALALIAKADELNLYLVTNDDTKLSFSLSELQQISFDNGSVVITKTSGSKTSLAISYVAQMYFNTEDADAIKLVQQSNESAQEIYSIDGRRMSEWESLPAGLYIVKHNNTTIKIIKQ